MSEAGFGLNDMYVASLRDEWVRDPRSVGPEWQDFFENEGGVPGVMAPSRLQSALSDAVEASYRNGPKTGASTSAGLSALSVKAVVSVGDTPQEQHHKTQAKVPAKPAVKTAGGDSDESIKRQPMRGISAKIAENMELSLGVPTAMSTRVLPVKVLEENRRIINQHLIDDARPKASFTHIIAWALIKSLEKVPAMNNGYELGEKGPEKLTRASVNLGLAIDLPGRNGTRTLVVPNIKNCETLTFKSFLEAYNDLVARARKNKIKPAEFSGTTLSLTNPGGGGTVASAPRLMAGQGTIVAVGKIGYPAEYEASAPETLKTLGVGKVMTMTSTYDHRVIQGAESGAFLRHVHECLNGEHGFYEDIFSALGIPHVPYHLERDRSHALQAERTGASTERAMKVSQLIHAFRVRGHILANCDPLDLRPRHHPELDLANYGLTIWDLDRRFSSFGVLNDEQATLRDILDKLRETYCRRTGVEYMYINDPEEREWLRARVEGKPEQFEKEIKLKILEHLAQATIFERFLHKRYLGHKRFSLEGGESLIPLLRACLARSAHNGVTDICIGMAHRGRLNVLANVLGKSYEAIFAEFDDVDPKTMHGSGDVKYHLGATGVYDWKGGLGNGDVKDGKRLRLSLACNPSHLEAVNPVVLGETRAKQDLHGDLERRQVMPILIHGDAAFAGQGVVYETMQMALLQGYRVGGSVHVIVNNQIGYTTGPERARSALNASDIARTVGVPVFRVNGDDPEACVRAIQIAVDYRSTFGKDVVIDLVCYRLHGHNEGDEPSFTQPILYDAIRSHPPVMENYGDWLVRHGDLERDDVEKVNEATYACLERAFGAIKEKGSDAVPEVGPTVPGYQDADAEEEPVTAVALEVLEHVAKAITTDPESVNVHPRLKKQILDKRHAMVFGPERSTQKAIDFGMAEMLAYGTLLLEDIPVRLSGQDCGRGTFAHRHAILYDCKEGTPYVSLNYLNTGIDEETESKQRVRFSAYDSLLSEEGVLGYEYGYSSMHPDALVIWEAQFGDFFNGAQIQIDQFITSGEVKWGQRSRVVMMLPHGYDGQGPEHSSARMERFLQQCAEENLRVAVCTNSAQQFHLLRQQAKQPKKPLILFTHKSLLRSSDAASGLDEFTSGEFQTVIDEPENKGAPVVLCAGKIYLELEKERQRRRQAGEPVQDLRVVRIESLYPFPKTQIFEEILQNESSPLWLQEEPRNMGAFEYIAKVFREKGRKIGYCGRAEAASPATGSKRRHMTQQRMIFDALLSGEALRGDVDVKA